MRYYTKRRLRRLIIFAAVTLIIVIGIGAFIYSRTRPPLYDLENHIIQVDADIITGWSGGFVMAKEQKITCVDAADNTLWECDVPISPTAINRYETLTAVWNSNQWFVIDDTGTIIQNREEAGTIVGVKCGRGMYAIAVNEDDTEKITVYNTSGKTLDDFIFPYQTILDMQFFGSTGSQLWTMALDSHGSVFVSRLCTYVPGQTMTGTIQINEEITYDALPYLPAGESSYEIYSVGTHSIDLWKLTGEQISTKMIYGWNLEDMQVNDKNQVRFLLSPSSINEEEQKRMATLWYIQPGGQEYRISLPTDCIGAVLYENGVIAVQTNGLYIISDNSNYQFIAVPFSIDEIVEVVSGKTLIVRSNTNGKQGIYLIPLD